MSPICLCCDRETGLFSDASEFICNPSFELFPQKHKNTPFSKHFGKRDLQKWYNAVATSTFASENVQNRGPRTIFGSADVKNVPDRIDRSIDR